MNRSNQFRQKMTRLRGSEDMDLEDKKTVASVLMRKGLGAKFNWYLFANETDWIIRPEVSYQDSERYNLIRHRPDVSVFGGSYFYGIIEVDGGVHAGRKKDWNRDRDYDILGIPFLVCNKADLAEVGTTLEDHVAAHLDLFSKPYKGPGPGPDKAI